MKTQTMIACAAAVLLSGAVAASAETVQPKASDSLNLSATQQKTAWTDLDHAKNQNAPSGFDAAAGSKLPASVKISMVPSKAARDISQLRPYDFAKVEGKLLIVNPRDRTVAQVISG